MDSLDRLSHPKMEFYREVYRDSERWNGIDPLKGSKVIVYCEQGFGDQIQFARYIPRLKEIGCEVTLQCSKELHRLFEQLNVGLIDKEQTELPEHDYHLLSMSLPFQFDDVQVEFPYLKAEKQDLPGDKLKIGIAWEGNPGHSNNDERSCPLAKFKLLHAALTVPHEFYMVQKFIFSKELLTDAEDFELLGTEIEDFLDTAQLIQGLDAIVAVDTAAIHLAGALNMRTYVLLSPRCDHRWNIGIDWYPSVKAIRPLEHSISNQPWDEVFISLIEEFQKDQYVS